MATLPYKLSGVSIPGLKHILDLSQDVLVKGQFGEWEWYVGSDGASSGENNTFGAITTALYFSGLILQTLKTKGSISGKDVKTLFKGKLTLGLLLALRILNAGELPDEKTTEKLIGEALEATLFGVISCPKYSIIFFDGDGHVSLNGNIQSINQEGHPIYPVYRLLPKTHARHSRHEIHTARIDHNQPAVVLIGSDAIEERSETFALFDEALKAGGDNIAVTVRRAAKRLQNPLRTEDDFTLIRLQIG